MPSNPAPGPPHSEDDVNAQPSSSDTAQRVGKEQREAREEEGEGEEASLADLALKWQRELESHYQARRQRELVATRTVKFSQPTLDLLALLSEHFDTTDADIIRSMCTFHRTGYSVAEETLDRLMLLIDRFATAFDEETASAGENAPERERARHLAHELRRQAKQIYQRYKRGERPSTAAVDVIGE